MKRKFHLSVILLILIAFCAAPVQSYALPPCHYEHNTYCGEDIYEPGSLEASYVDYVQGVWKCDTRLAKKGALCGRWSNSVRKTFSSSMKEINYYGLRFNEKNFLAKCKGCKAGTKLVLGQAKYENGTLSHAIILFKVTANEVWWADCNWNHDNVVHYRHGTVKDFVNFYHYKKSKYSYLHFIVKINSYRHYSTPKIASANTVTDGTARIVWTKTSGAEKYRVYRSASKGGEYSCVAETDVCSYKDTAAEAGKTYYYKVAAVDKSGKSHWSGVVSAKTQLDRPHTSLNYAKGGMGTLVWNAVPQADRYDIYRRPDSGKWKKIASTTDTSYTNSKMKRGKKYWYKVVAVGSGGGSTASEYSPWITTTTYAWVP